MRKTLRALGVGTVAATLGFGALLATSTSASAADNTIVIWVNQERAANYKAVMPPTFKGYNLKMVFKDPNTFRDDLIKASGDDAPDIAINAHDWTGQLVANGTIVKLNVPASALKAFNPQAVNGFRVGTGIYGMPLQVENIALITNKKLVPTNPKTFAELSTTALALKKSGKATVPLALPAGIPYFMQPILTGLGGYYFGTNPNGSFNTKDVGLTNPTFKKNYDLLNSYNKSGLINSKVDYGIAADAFKAGKSPFWINGPWVLSDLKALPFPYTITPVPALVPGIPATPFFGAQGAWVTKWAKVHGVELGANTVVTSLFSSPTFQLSLAKSDGRYPANLKAQAAFKEPILAAFAAAGKGALPMPNIPQMDSVFGVMTGTYTNTFAGTSAIPAQKTFPQAQAQVTKLVK